MCRCCDDPAYGEGYRDGVKEGLAQRRVGWLRRLFRRG